MPSVDGLEGRSTRAGRYALIAGQGRSGTNWLLDLLDLSPHTFCRNEPYMAPESPMNTLEKDRFVVREDTSELDAGWDTVVDETFHNMGYCDRVITARKDFMYSAAQYGGAYRVARGPRLKGALSKLMPSLRGEEFPMPRWLASPAAIERAYGVLKLVTSPGWAVWVLRNRPQVPVMHIVRHPGGFMNSWARRYVAENEQAQVLRENLERLHTIASVDPAWGERFGDIDSQDIDESELWYWLYANQVVADAGQGCPAYRFIAYEELAAEPARLARPLYDACGLEWSDAIERRIGEMGTQSMEIARAWREKLSPEQVALAERFLDEASSFFAPE